jgi:hypothetical protein
MTAQNYETDQDIADIRTFLIPLSIFMVLSVKNLELKKFF